MSWLQNIGKTFKYQGKSHNKHKEMELKHRIPKSMFSQHLLHKNIGYHKWQKDPVILMKKLFTCITVNIHIQKWINNL